MLAALGAALAAALLVASPATAGGWAISSLDPLPELVAGEEIPVGFTILQHGVTPTGGEDLGEVSVVIRSDSGRNETFAARPDGAEGHFVAEVTFPESGSFTWTVNQGWFGPYELGRVDVAGASGGSATGSAPSAGDPGYRWPLGLRLLLPLVAAATLAWTVADWRRQHRVLPASLTRA